MISGHHHPISGRRLFWTIVLNSIITLAEFVVHNLSDVAALILAWFGVKGSQLPATKRSTYGFKRVEVMTAFISAVALVVIALFIIWVAYRRFLNPVPLEMPGLFLSVAAVGLLGNLTSVALLHREKDKSLNLKTAFLHMAYDTLSSVVVLGGGVVILFTGWTLVDPILSAAIALMIFWSSYLVIKEATLILMEAVPPGVDFDEVHRAINGAAEVCSVHDLHIWSLSSYEFALSCHVIVPENSYAQGPQIVDDISRLMRDRFGIGHSTIQIEHQGCERSNLLCGPEHHHAD
jgi:cobalt-zinc-cadmium efflux system protein